jgi:hypothetical protein
MNARVLQDFGESFFQTTRIQSGDSPLLMPIQFFKGLLWI